MNVLVRKLIDLYQSLMRWYYSWRYGPVARQLESPPEGERRGFVAIQIDGLGHAALLEAVTRGYAPYLAGLMRSGEAEVFRWFAGIPSTTPVVQAKIMFGTGYDVPGFRWYEKESGRAIVCKVPAVMDEVQQRLSAGRRGALEGGASYTNMFDGGASVSLFTLAAIGRTSLIEKVGGLPRFLIMLFSPLRVARILALSVWTYLAGVWRQLSALFWPSKFSRLGFLSPFFHVLTDVVVREVETFAVLVDVYRGVPYIYANYSSYDAWAHSFGPEDTYALRSVRAIDRQVQQIDRMRRRRGGRPYDLFVLSDHGQTPSVPFETAFGVSLGQFIDSRIEQPTRTDESMTEVGQSGGSSSLLGYEVGVAEARLKGLPSEAARTLRESLEAHGTDEPTDLSRRTDIVVRNSGPLSHVYFNVSEAPMSLKSLEAVYPGLVPRLAAHPGIGVVGLRSAAGPLLVTTTGTYLCEPGNGEGAFAGLPDAGRLVEDTRMLLSYPHSGDLVLLGQWDWWGRSDLVVTFEHQRSTHGGVGGEQCYPFILGVGEGSPALVEVRGPTDIYELLVSYQERPQAEEPTAVSQEAWESGARLPAADGLTGQEE